MHDSRISGGTKPGVKVGSVRLWDSGTKWRDIETAPGVFDFAALDRAVATAKSAGARPLIVLGQTPQFWAENPLSPAFYGDGASSMPNLAAWKTYVGKVASRYKNSADYQIWNEPNVSGFWTGTVGQMVKLTQTASAKIRQVAGRNATVVAPSFPLRLEPQRTWYRKYWASRVGGKSVASFVSVVTVNPYPLPGGTPEASMALVRFAKRALPKEARSKPMWNTEINYGLKSGVQGGQPAREISQARQAAYVARTLVLNAANNISRVYWYAWTISPIANTHLAQDGYTTLTAAGRAWGVVRSWIVATNVSKCVKTSSGKLKGLYTCTARKGTSEVRRIYWKPSGGAVRITTPSTTKRWSNLAGRTTTRQGRFAIKVGEAPVMVASRR